MLHPCAFFVFGSNLKGIHGAGAALTAKQKYGAVEGWGRGIRGRSYALPTKITPWKSLQFEDVEFYVNEFINWAIECAQFSPTDMFVVTRVGCGHAGYSDEQIAPLFKRAPSNCFLPEGWI